MEKRILVVDDHAATRLVIRAAIDSDPRNRYEFIEAATGAECLEAVRARGPFDLILLDIGLPDMDGLSVCREIRKTDSLTPVVFVTSKGELTDVAAGRLAGGDSYLVKPIARLALRSLVGLFTSVPRSDFGRSKPRPS